MAIRPLTGILAAATAVFAQTNVVTYHNDNARTGRYLTETLLTPSSVQPGLFGRRFWHLLDGAALGQPLYLARVNVAGKGLHDLLFVATAHDTLYAFDADDASGSNAQPLWQASFLNEGAGITSVSAVDVNCPVIQELGVVGTPVIDPDSGTLYLIAETKEPGPSFHFRLHAIDVTSGAERPESPVEIQAPGFVPLAHKQRGALLLSGGVVYSPWSSHCDHGSYHGWIFAHDAATLELLGVFNVSPDGNGASFWNAGAGPAADAEGNVYVVSANGDFDVDAGGSDYGDSVVKLSARSLSVLDYFTPFNQLLLANLDLDLGSSGAVLLPDEAGTAAHPHLLFTGGKEGRLYLLDRDHPGGTQSEGDPGALASLPVFSNSAMGSAAYFNHTIYVASNNSPFCAFPVSDAALSTSPAFQSADQTGALGAIASISANGGSNGIVWALPFREGGTLRAYNAADLEQLYDSNSTVADELDSFVEFGVPTVANGKVYAGTLQAVAVFGLLSSTQPVLLAAANSASFDTSALSPGSLISLFGSGLAPATTGAANTPLPISLADVSLAIGGMPAPLLYVSSGQINAQVPAGLAPGPASITVEVSGVFSQSMPVTLIAAAPGIFAGADQQAAAVNQDGSLNGQTHPAPAGTVVSVYLTGQGPVNGNLLDGAPAPGNTPIAITSRASATIGGVPASIQFAGLAPGFAGLGQFNLKIPALADGNYPVVITIGDKASNAARLAVSSH